MPIAHEYVAVILFVVAIVGNCFGRASHPFPPIPWSTARCDEDLQTFLALELEIVFVNCTDILRQALKRTFANLYGVSPDTGCYLDDPTSELLGSNDMKDRRIAS